MFLRNNIEEKNEEENLVLRVGRTKRRNRTRNMAEFKNNGKNFSL
jgi:hypothetical protein